MAWLLVLEQLIFQTEAEARWLDHCESRLIRLSARAARSGPGADAPTPAAAPRTEAAAPAEAPEATDRQGAEAPPPVAGAR